MIFDTEDDERVMINRLVIFGDSYSTHKDYIPAGYPHYYCTEGRDVSQPVTKMRPEETWWWQFIEHVGAQLVLNDSWSGSTIGYTGYLGDCSTSSSFIYRYRKLLEKNFFGENKVDTFIIFGGTNDSWSNAPLGEVKYSDFCENDLYCVLPAICHFMTAIKNDNPEARVIFIGNCDIKREILDCMKDAANKIGAEFIELSDVDKIEGHPTVLGMKQIYEQVIGKIN